MSKQFSPSQIIERNPILRKYWTFRDIGQLVRLGFVKSFTRNDRQRISLLSENEVMQAFEMMRNLHRKTKAI